MMIPIAVSQRVDIISARNERRDALDQRLIDLLANAGCLAIPVPNNLGLKLDIWLANLKPFGILLSGGNDLGEVPERDLTESKLLAYAEHEKIPLLGICRGMQMMAVYSGASLKAVNGHISTNHELKWNEKSQTSVPKVVNSFHAFTIADCPNGYNVLARSSFDKEIEAIGHSELPWLGWMWHPERAGVESKPMHLDLIRRLFFQGKY
jgi:putative glutamine amidotransferase